MLMWVGVGRWCVDLSAHLGATIRASPCRPAFRSLLPLLSRRLVPALAGLLASASIWSRAGCPSRCAGARALARRSRAPPSRWSTMRRWTRSIPRRASGALLGKAALYTCWTAPAKPQRSVDGRARARHPHRDARRHLWLETCAIARCSARDSPS